MENDAQDITKRSQREDIALRNIGFHKYGETKKSIEELMKIEDMTRREIFEEITCMKENNPNAFEYARSNVMRGLKAIATYDNGTTAEVEKSAKTTILRYIQTDLETLAEKQTDRQLKNELEFVSGVAQILNFEVVTGQKNNDIARKVMLGLVKGTPDEEQKLARVKRFFNLPPDSNLYVKNKENIR